MLEVIKETLIDSLKILPFLFFVFLIMEFIEHKFSDKRKILIEKSGKFGPLLGGLLGGIPQCGFSVAMTNLYATRIVSMGTLVAIYLSTTDEMIPILLTNGVPLVEILKLVGIQMLIAIIFGFIIDIFVRRKNKESIKDFCDLENCDCEHDGIFKSSMRHSLNIFMFILIITFIINAVMFYIGDDFLSNLFLKGSIFSPLIASTIGLIPNCVSSVMLTKLYLSGAISYGSVISGLLMGSGVSYLVLFRVNKNLKENISIVGIIYVISFISGIIIDLIF